MPKIHKSGYVTGRQPFSEFVCLECQKKMSSKTAARLHQKAVHGKTHSKIEKLKCITCFRKFDTKAQMQDHLKSHEKKLNSEC